MVLWLPPTNRVHGVRSELEYPVEYESATLEKHITPVPTIVLDDIVSLSLYPQVEPDQGYSTEPPVGESQSMGLNHSRAGVPSHVHSERQAFRDTEASKCEHAVGQEVTWIHILSVQNRHRRYSNVLEQNDIHDLPEQQPSIVLERQILVFFRNDADGWSGWAISRRKSNLCPFFQRAAP